ncbi:AAA family ATPase [Actinomyces dentalis]|uniref:AAA family ATPase n=1 Tax=Actinomyces dentalis TaxID=272548 RepID=UPI000478CB07|nr:ATP-binding protein [Actinomyces dentalis]
MRSPLDSPFSPGSDTVPEVWAGRTSHLSDWRDILRPRRAAGLHERGRTILGEAGSGKSSLVRRIAREASQSGDWATPQLRIPSGTDPLKRVASALLDLSAAAGLAAAREQRIGDLLRRVETVAASGVSLSVRAQDGPEPYIALTDLLIEIGRAAIRRGDVMVVIHIDEVQNIGDENARSQLLIALGDALTHEETVDVPGGLRIERGLPIAVYLTGLPEFADTTGARKGATFARRFRTTTLDAIDDDALTSALQPFVTEGWPIADDAGGVGRVFMEPAAQRAIVEFAHGEPFLFQLAGERAWYAGTDDLITAEHVRTGWRDAAPEAEAHVQRILDRLPPRERHFLESMAALPPEERTLTNIARSMGYERTTDAGPTAQRLDLTRGIIRRGRPYDFRHRAVGAYLTSEWPWLS